MYHCIKIPACSAPQKCNTSDCITAHLWRYVLSRIKHRMTNRFIWMPYRESSEIPKNRDFAIQYFSSWTILFKQALWLCRGLWSAQPSWACRRAQGNGTVNLQAPGKRKQHFTVTSLECLRLFWLLSWKADKETITQKDMWPISGQRGNSVLSNFDNSSAC